MRITVSLLGLMLLVSVLVAGCSGGGSPSDRAAGPPPGGAPPTAQYWPLKVGDFWKYRATHYKAATVSPGDAMLLKALGLPGGTVPSSTTNTAKYTITGTTKIGGVTWFLMKYAAGSWNETTYDMHDAQGFAEKMIRPEPPWFWLKNPLNVGAKWSISPDGAVKGKVLSLTANVTVPVGTFGNCLQVQQTWTHPSGNQIAQVWYAPNKGEVKSEWREGGVLTDKTELTATNVGG